MVKALVVQPPCKRAAQLRALERLLAKHDRVCVYMTSSQDDAEAVKRMGVLPGGWQDFPHASRGSARRRSPRRRSPRRWSPALRVTSPTCGNEADCEEVGLLPTDETRSMKKVYTDVHQLGSDASSPARLAVDAAGFGRSPDVAKSGARMRLPRT